MQLQAISGRPHSSLLPMLLIGALFFIFGFVTWLNGALIPFLKIACQLNEFQAMLVAFVFYIAYFVMALPVSGLLARYGYKQGMVLGLAVMVLGALLFIPAALSAAFPLFLLALFVLGTGLTLLQTASNPYIVCVGPRESAAMRISCMGIVNKGVGFIVPLLFSAWVLTGMEAYSDAALAAMTPEQKLQQLTELSERLIQPYLLMALVLSALTLFVWWAPLPKLDFEQQQKRHWRELKQYPQVWLGALTLFCYVGVEVIAGDSIGLFGQQLGVANFGVLTSYTMAFMVLGYLLGIALIPRWISQPQALLASAVLGLLFSAGVLYSSPEHTLLADLFTGWLSIAAIPDPVFYLALLGLANALVWPAVWPLALQGLGALTATASALLIMGIAGGAVLPLFYGYLAGQSSNQAAYWLLLPCYAMIFYYALLGHKKR
ncbi:sugar MFS transporter [Rheinheimera sp.]|uniref:sugar MFS transporter n=1 Tax=Rheinheimera sp. TaxID=1869214 RepID=UPI00307F6F67